MSFNEKREFETIDDDIAKLEQAIADTEEQMEKSASQYSKLQELSQQKEDLEVVGISAGSNIEMLEAQIRRFHPLLAAVGDEKKHKN